MTSNYELELRQCYETACNDYAKLFCHKHEYDFDPTDWVGLDIGTVLCLAEYYYINFQDIKYDIDNEVDRSVFFEWYNYDITMRMLEAQTMNYPSWVKGAPRRSQEWIDGALKRQDAIRQLEQQLRDYVESDF